MENHSFFLHVREILNGIEAYHDSYTMKHEYRTARLMAILANAIGLSENDCASLEAVGALHDIGKVALPSYILEKPGPLTVFERQTVELHPQIGYELLKKIKTPLGESACTVSLTHHEAYDGSGYPNRLAGKNIPLEGRICRVCDVYDALRAYRPYQIPQAMDHHTFCIQLMTDKGENGMASQFDPELLEIFQRISEKYQYVYTDVFLSTIEPKKEV